MVDMAIAWRWTVVFLLEVCAFSLDQVVRTVHKRASECIKWANRFWENGNVDDLHRSGRPAEISDGDVERVKKALSEAPPGTGLKVVLHNLGLTCTVEAMRQQLGNHGWSFQKVKTRLPLGEETMEKRWAYAHKYRDVGLGNKAIFTDSKYFEAGTVDFTTRQSGFHSWAPDGQPRQVIKTQGTNFSAHVYGGVCKWGLTSLHFVSGTKGMAAAYKVDRKNPAYTANGTQPEKVTINTSSVAHKEYRDIVMGGGPRHYKGLIKEAKRMFEYNGETNWYWQQDGAPAHSIKSWTTIGKKTRELIESITLNIVEWPPYSPDLSPIETVWNETERVLWRDFQWDSQASFEKALGEAWEKVGKNKAFIKKVMASVDRRAGGNDKGGRIAQVLARKGGQTDY